MKKPLKSIKSEVKGVVLMATGLFLFISLYTYNPNDRIFFENQNYSLSPVLNACGHFGAFLSVLFLKLLGFASYAVSGLIVLLSLNAFKKKENSIDKLALGFLFVTLISVTLEIYLKFMFKVESENPGGWVGYLLGSYLLNIFSSTGTSILLVAMYLILTFLTFDNPQQKTLDIVHGISLKLKPILSFIYTKLTNLKFRIFKDEEVHLNNKNTVIETQDDYHKGTEVDDDFVEHEENEADTAVPISPIVKMALKRRQAQKEETYKIESFKRDSTKKVSRRIKDSDWEMPSLDLLNEPPSQFEGMSEEEIRDKSNLLVAKLDQFSVKGKITGVKSGPAVTLFEFRPNADIKISKITELADDLSLALASESVRIIAPIPGRDVVGIETSNSKRDTVFIKDILSMDTFWKDDMMLPIGLGRRADGYPMVVDLRKMPHLLVAGSTGSGKSVFVVSLIVGLLLRHSPKKLKLILVDPKQVDLAAFNDLPHLLIPPIRDSKKSVNALRWAINEMDKRYRSMSKFKVRDLEGFNEKVGVFTEEEVDEHNEINAQINLEAPMKSYYFQQLPYIVIIVEEFGDLMAVDKVNVEQAVVRLAQMARACGIHLVLAMQSPRKDVVTGLIKTNIPGRISFKVASKMDSRVILDESGAERLLSRGDMLFQSPGVSKPIRAHGAYVSEAEIEDITKVWKSQSEPMYDEKAMRAVEGSSSNYSSGEGSDGESGGSGVDDMEEFDDRYDEILEQVSGMKEVSASMLQRKFRLGYPRAARMIEVFEQQGVVGPANGSKPRKVLISSLKDL